MLMLIWGVELKNDRLAIIGIHIIKIIRPHDRFMLLNSLTTKLLRGMKGSRLVEKTIDFPLNFNLEGKSLVECATLMFKTHKMGIRYLNGALFSNETQWREDMF